MAISAEKLAALRAKAAASRSKEATTNVTETAPESPQPSSALAVSTTVIPDSNLSNSSSLVATSDPVCQDLPRTASMSGCPSIAQSADLTPQQFLVVEKIEKLAGLLGQQNPGIEFMLKQIHTALAKDPELMHFLRPDQIGTVVKGCMEVTKIVVVTAAVKKTTTTSGKKLSQLTLADL